MATLPRGGLSDIELVSCDVDAITSQVVADIEAATGTSLSSADVRRIIALALCQCIVQARADFDAGQKQTFLSYATGEYIDHHGWTFAVPRPGPTSATCLVQFTRTEAVESADIPSGVELSGAEMEWTAGSIHFDAGSYTSNPTTATCETPGTSGNGVAIGQISTIVTPNTILATVTNISASNGATDEMGDDEYIELIRNRGDAYSCAGPSGAYKYFAKSASNDVQDVALVNHSPAELDLYVLKTGGVIPDESDPVIDAVLEACSAETVRPVGDVVRVHPAVAVPYNIDISYKFTHEAMASIGEANASARVNSVVAEYVAWQCAKIGRDINPDELVHRLLSIGAKRVIVRAPVFAEVGADSVASIGSLNVDGGVEDE